MRSGENLYAPNARGSSLFSLCPDSAIIVGKKFPVGNFGAPTMSLLLVLITIIGLCLFEIVSSIDNAVINAEILSTIGARARRWFLRWGILIAVFLVRGLLPWLILWLSTPGLGPSEAFTQSLSNDPSVAAVIEKSAPMLLTGGGIFLFFLFLHWLFIEDKNYGLPGERFISKQGSWFYAIVSIALLAVTGYYLNRSPAIAFAAVAGSTAFFITNGFKQNAEEQESRLRGSGISDISKLLYLEAIDATFSIDGVLGAFAFTFSVPLIIIGNGIGAFIVRWITVSNVDRISNYLFLKNGAMYSIGLLGLLMLLEGSGVHIPQWVSPLATAVIVSGFFLKSVRYAKAACAEKSVSR